MLCIAMESHPINEKVLLKLFLCEGLWLWKKVLRGWRVQGSKYCCHASLDVQKAWNSHSALANPNVCSTLLFPVTPWGPFTSTAVALQRSSSTTISTRLLDGICCKLSRPWKNPCDSDMHETTHCSEGSRSGEYSLPY